MIRKRWKLVHTFFFLKNENEFWVVKLCPFTGIFLIMTTLWNDTHMKNHFAFCVFEDTIWMNIFCSSSTYQSRPGIIYENNLLDYSNKSTLDIIKNHKIICNSSASDAKAKVGKNYLHFFFSYLSQKYTLKRFPSTHQTSCIT